MTKREHRTVWNQAVRAACDEVLKYDGIIPDKIDREYMADKIREKWCYKYLGKKTNRRKVLKQN